MAITAITAIAAIAAAAALVLIACDGDSDDASALDGGADDRSTATAPGNAGDRADPSTGIEAMQLGSAWVFSHMSSDGAYALHGGQAAIVDGCLLVGDAVVIWAPDQLDDVQRILGLLDEGEEVSVRVGGGGLSLEEGSTLDDFPAVVLEHCSPRELWFAARGVVAIESPGAAEAQPGSVGFRCETAGDCAAGLHCRGDFFFERSVCTAGCSGDGGDGDCPAGSLCVTEVPDFNSTTVGPYCLRPCQAQADCEVPLGSDCDSIEPLTDRFCF